MSRSQIAVARCSAATDSSPAAHSAPTRRSASDGELPWLAAQTYLEPFPAALRRRRDGKR